MISFQEKYGLEKIEVRDNGSGIPLDDRKTVALPHFTSKLRTFNQISEVPTYGFRGEAVAAICAVANLQMTTKTDSDKLGRWN